MNTHTGRIKLIIGPMFARKCLANGTRVVLYNGVVAPVESLTLDDMLTGDDYQPRKITAIVRAWGPQMYTVSASASASVMPASKRQCARSQARSQARSLASNDAARTHDTAHAYIVNDTHVLTVLVDKYNAPIDVPVATALKMQAAGQQLYGLRQPVHAAHNCKQLCAPAVLGAWLRWEATEWHYCEPPPLPYAVATAPIPREYLDTSPADKRELICGLYGSANTLTQDMPTRDARERNCLTFATRHLRDIEQILHSLYTRHDIVYTDARTTTVLLHCTHAIDMDASLQCDCMRVPIVITAAPAQQYTGFEIVPVDSCALAPAPHAAASSAHKAAPSAQRFMLADGTITHNSTTLCSDIDRYFIANHKCVIVRHTIDTRCLNAYITTDATVQPHEKIDFIHSGKIAQVPVIWTSAIADVYTQLLQYDVIGIDEIQFFDDCTLAHALANAGKVVICAGLDATYQLQPFGRIGELVALADEVVKLRAVCQRCYGEAAFTERKAGGSDVIEIGAADKYAAICRACLVALSPAGALTAHDITQ